MFLSARLKGEKRVRKGASVDVRPRANLTLAAFGEAWLRATSKPTVDTGSERSKTTVELEPHIKKLQLPLPCTVFNLDQRPWPFSLYKGPRTGGRTSSKMWELLGAKQTSIWCIHATLFPSTGIMANLRRRTYLARSIPVRRTGLFPRRLFVDPTIPT